MYRWKAECSRVSELPAETFCGFFAKIEYWNGKISGCVSLQLLPLMAELGRKEVSIHCRSHDWKRLEETF